MNLTEKEDETARVFVIGFGNPLRGDDGAGRRVVSELESGLMDGVNVELRECIQLLPEHAADVANADLVFFADASLLDEPGKVVLREVYGEDGDGGVNHFGSPEDVLKKARDLYGAKCRAYVCSIGGRDFGLSEELSPQVRDASIRAAAEIKKTTKEFLRKKRGNER